MTPQSASMIEAVRQRAAARRRRQSLERLRDLVNTDSWRRERFALALSAPSGKTEHSGGMMAAQAQSGALRELKLIAELYRQSPAGGVLLREEARPGTNPVRQPIPGPRWHALVDAVRTAGVAALAVWTEEDHYGCTLEDLLTVGHAKLPRLRRDLVLDEGMVREALNYGADAIELRADTLDDAQLASLNATVRELGAASVLRAADEQELRRVLACEPDYVLIAGRERWAALRALVPAGRSVLLEGDVRGREDLELAARLGVQGLLIGEPLIRSSDPAALLRAWLA